MGAASTPTNSPSASTKTMPTGAADAATTPAARLVLMLAAVHAARAGAIRALLLDDVDLGNRRLTIAGRTRLIDEFSHQILLEWLDYRRTR
jgi:integrase